MAGADVSGSGFTARTGVLTLLYVASSTERHVLLEMLAEIVMGVTVDEDPGEPDELEDDEVFDPNVMLDPFIVQADEADLEPGGLIGPDTPMRITPAGEELLFVGFALDRWLHSSPAGPLELGTNAAGVALTALACGWTTTAVHALAREALTVEELSHAIEDVSYRVLQERVEAMEEAGQVEAIVDADGTVRYAPTKWLCEGIAPIVAATRLEHRHPAEGTSPPDSLDVEAAFLLALPLLELPTELVGSCQLAVQVPDEEPRLAGVTVEVGEGRVLSATTQLDADTETWAIGSLEDWLETVVDPRPTESRPVATSTWPAPCSTRCTRSCSGSRCAERLAPESPRERFCLSQRLLKRRTTRIPK